MDELDKEFQARENAHKGSRILHVLERQSGGFKVASRSKWLIVSMIGVPILITGFVWPVGAEPSVAISASQPTGIAAFHRSGQTFLTWQENAAVSDESYAVYRHTEAITALNIASAQRLATLPEGSSIYYTERTRALEYLPEQNGGYTSLSNYVIQPLAAQLSDATGLFVWTTTSNGNAYYAVTTSASGSENRTEFTSGNTVGPIAETVADPAPIMVWRSAEGYGRVYTQFMDYANWNPTYARKSARIPNVMRLSKTPAHNA